MERKFFIKPLYLILGLVVGIFIIVLSLSSSQNQSPVQNNQVITGSPSVTPSPTTDLEKLNLQLADVENKIRELPELEKDIFSKCMEGKFSSEANFKSCQETTQKNILALSQELTNLKKTLEQQKSEIEQK